MQGQFDLSNIQDGLLPAAFMVGLLVASPIFAESSKHSNAFRLIGIGMGIWTLATMGCGFSTSFYMLLFFRMLVGVGEASFVSLAAPFIGQWAALLPHLRARTQPLSVRHAAHSRLLMMA